MYIYFIPIFAMSFSATFLDLGLIGGASAFTYVMTPILVGYLADRFNRVWLYMLGILFNVFSAFILPFSRSVSDIILFRLLGGVGLGFFWPAAEVLVTDLAPVDKRVREMGLYSVATSSGYLVGPLVGGLVVQYIGFGPLFTISAALMALAVLPSLLLVTPRYKNEKQVTTANFSTIRLTIRKLIPWYLMIICYAIVFSVITSILPGSANTVGISPSMIGIIFAAFNFSRIIAFAACGWCTKFGERIPLLISSCVTALSIFAVAIIPSFLGFLVFLILIGGCFGLIFPITISLISRHFLRDNLGLAVGSYETFMGIGLTVGPIFVGIVATEWNISTALLVTSIFGLLMFAFVFLGSSQTSPINDLIR
jgi:DHA1 family multidrug resistance protein-like MFS transporter